MPADNDRQVLFSAGTIADAYRQHLEPVIFRPRAARLLDLAGPQPGQRLLDVACGTGVVARAAATRLGRDGQIIASDISPGMLAHVPVDFPVGEASVETLEASATAARFEPIATKSDTLARPRGRRTLPGRLRRRPLRDEPRRGRVGSQRSRQVEGRG